MKRTRKLIHKQRYNYKMSGVNKTRKVGAGKKEKKDKPIWVLNATRL